MAAGEAYFPDVEPAAEGAVPPQMGPYQPPAAQVRSGRRVFQSVACS
jgi:hypothetical protein